MSQKPRRIKRSSLGKLSGLGFRRVAENVVIAGHQADRLLTGDARAFHVIGLLGSFTTFSTFGYETFELVNNGQFGRAGLNILLSNLAGLAAVWLGYRLTEQVAGV